MHAFQINSHINENGILSVKLPKGWAEKDVNVVMVLNYLDAVEQAVLVKFADFIPAV